MLRINAVALMAGLATAGLAGVSEAEPNKAHLELFAGQFLVGSRTDGDFRHGAFGLRGTRWLNDRWGLGGSLSFLPLSDFDSPTEDLDSYFLDFLASYRVFRGERFSAVLTGGPGLFREEFEEDSVRGTDHGIMLHLGLGFEVGLTERIFLRPDLRARWIDDVGEIHTDATLGLGLRF